MCDVTGIMLSNIRSGCLAPIAGTSCRPKSAHRAIRLNGLIKIDRKVSLPYLGDVLAGVNGITGNRYSAAR